MTIGLLSHPNSTTHSLLEEDLAYLHTLLETLEVTDVLTTFTPAWENLVTLTALESGIHLTGVLPCSEYAEIFDDYQALQQLTQLWTLADHLHALPFEYYSEEAMAAAQRWIVKQSDAVFSLDRSPNEGLLYAEKLGVTIYQPLVLA
ncbi:MAG TPA: hypothetical protein DCE41_02100 [Cytophagales bacterium]|nr:hypothetical protein [Cytophagales bacterium]HAA21267.1 hypothetical protein [Cytophagales bacterium]HAP63492.1 hypothetical protein [Cytophagales bacterium]